MKINLNFIKETFYFKEVTSTNDIALSNIDKEEFTIFIADKQTKGRGRNNREWFSSSPKNLYFSFILQPDIEAQYLTSLPVYTAFALYQTIKDYLPEKPVYIKWPNDILIENRKISGILIEGKRNKLVVGIGINVNIGKLPNFELNTPTSLHIEAEGKIFDKQDIIEKFFKYFKEYYDIFIKEKKIRDDILSKINNVLFLKDEYVEIIYKNSEKKSGKILGLNENGSIKLDTFNAYAGDIKKILKGKL